MKIVNFSKFIRSILMIVGIVVAICLFITNTSFSHEEVTYKTIYVGNGDTLWSIAREQKEENEYYRNKDIRDIVDSIKDINNLNNSDLKINQQLSIPEL